MAADDMGAARDLAKSDTPNAKFDWIMVTGSTGSVVVDQVGGNTVTLASVPTAVWIPLSNGLNIRTSSTAVGFMVT